jgi:hypothetical protein
LIERVLLKEGPEGLVYIGFWLWLAKASRYGQKVLTRTVNLFLAATALIEGLLVCFIVAVGSASGFNLRIHKSDAGDEAG